MTEATRLIGMLRASAAQNADRNKRINHSSSPYTTFFKIPKLQAEPERRNASPVSLLEGLVQATKHGVSRPPEPLSAEFKAGLSQVLHILNTILPAVIVSSSPSKQQQREHGNDVAIENCQRFFTVRSNNKQLRKTAKGLGIPILPPDMAGRFPVLSTSNLPQATPEEQAANASPARGHAMLNSIFKSVRVPEFRFKWMFWAEKGQQSTPKDKAANSDEYASRPKPLGEQIISVKEFYQHFNNIPVENLKLRDSIHLFHLGVKPVWEDPRNARGGAWYFKVSKDIASQFWHEMCLLAVGDILQSAIETKRACK